jgi:hypothetical protein
VVELVHIQIAIVLQIKVVVQGLVAVAPIVAVLVPLVKDMLEVLGHHQQHLKVAEAVEEQDLLVLQVQLIMVDLAELELFHR